MIATYKNAGFAVAAGVLAILTATSASARPAILERVSELNSAGTSRNGIVRVIYSDRNAEGVAVASTDVSSAIAVDAYERESDILTVLDEIGASRTSRNGLE